MTVVYSHAIEKSVADDVISILETAGVANCIREQEAMPDAATAVVVKVLNVRGNLAAGTIPTGFRQADMAVEVMTHESDDLTGTTFNALIASVRGAIWDDGIVAALTAASTYCTYYALLDGDDVPDQDGLWRVMSIQFSLVMRPSKNT